MDRIRFIKGIIKQLYEDGMISLSQYSDMCKFFTDGGINAGSLR